MIGIVDVEIQAKNPNLPLHPLYAYINSPSSLRVRNVPRKIGQWQITSVQAQVTYPDGSIVSAECVQNGNLWIGTVEGTSTPGTSQFGYTIYANGIDENGDTVSGYVLGKGLVEILDDNGSIAPSTHATYTKLLSAQPDNPKEGDLYPLSGEYYIWQNGAAHAIGDAGAISALSAVVEDKRGKTDFSVYTYAPWTMYSFNEEEVSPPLNFIYQKVIYANDTEIYGWMSERERGNLWFFIGQSGISWFTEGGTIDEQGRFTPLGGDNLVISDDGLSFTQEGSTPVDIRRTTAELVPTSDTLAKVSQIPTIPQSYDKIQDSSNNVINANRTVSYEVTTYHWKLYDGFENEYDFTGTKTNSEWQSGSDKMKLYMPDSSHWTLQRFFDLGGTWITSWSETIEGSEDDNSMTFLEHGYNGTWFDTHTITSDELALKSYVDGLIGDINTVLDTINGEVI